MKVRILPPAPAAASGKPGGAPPSATESLLNPQRGGDGEARMHVYAGGYTARMREALAEIFEAVAHVLGESVFAELAEDYSRSHPSHDYNLNFAGRHLPEFLRSWPRTQELPFLPDLAQLEWLVCRAFHACDQPPVDPKRVAAASPDQWDSMTLVFQPSVGLIASHWPVLDIWQARKTLPGQINISLVDRPQRVLVFRRSLQVVCEPLDETQYFVLAALHGGQPLGEVCAALQARTANPPPLTDWFSRWMRLGLIVHLASGKPLC